MAVLRRPKIVKSFFCGRKPFPFLQFLPAAPPRLSSARKLFAHAPPLTANRRRRRRRRCFLIFLLLTLPPEVTPTPCTGAAATLLLEKGTIIIISSCNNNVASSGTDIMNLMVMSFVSVWYSTHLQVLHSVSCKQNTPAITSMPTTGRLLCSLPCTQCRANLAT